MEQIKIFETFFEGKKKISLGLLGSKGHMNMAPQVSWKIWKKELTFEYGHIMKQEKLFWF